MQITNVSVMAKPLPKWVMKRYAALWDKFDGKEFTFEEAQKGIDIDKSILSLLLSEMKKAGWIEVRLNPHDSRRRLYKLIEPNKVLKYIAKER